LRILQLYSWIEKQTGENKTNTSVKHRKHKSKKNAEKTHKNMQNTLIKSAEHKKSIELFDNFSNRMQ